MSEQESKELANTTKKTGTARKKQTKSTDKNQKAPSSTAAPKSSSAKKATTDPSSKAKTTVDGKSTAKIAATTKTTKGTSTKTSAKSKSTPKKSDNKSAASRTSKSVSKKSDVVVDTPNNADITVSNASNDTNDTVEMSKIEAAVNEKDLEKEAASDNYVTEENLQDGVVQLEVKSDNENTDSVDSNETVATSDNTKLSEVVEESEYLNGNKPLLQVKNLKKYFLINNSFLAKNRKYLHAVEGVSFDLFAGKTIGIVGESGCGKTTMGRTILRLTDVTDGEILFKGIDLAKLKGEKLRKLRPQFQMIFQDPYSSLSPRMPVGEIIGEAVKVHNIVSKSEYKDYIIDIMQKCGLQSHYFERYPHEFSGGQRQRICIAKVLALNPQLVICDEPVSALDVSIQAQIINLFKDLQDTHNLAYVFISHDLSVVEHISDDVGVMYLGNMVELAPKKELFAHPMHPYTEALLSAVPMPDPSVKMNRITLNGDIPSPANPPKGCKFHTRCTKCMDVCKEVEPKFKNYGNGHCVACHLYSQD